MPKSKQQSWRLDTSRPTVLLWRGRFKQFGLVYIVGAANSAGQAAMYFSKHARSVTMLVRGESLSAGMSQYLEDQLAATKNVVVKLNTCVVDCQGQRPLRI